MSLYTRPIQELLSLAANGGGFTVKATRPAQELIAIAANAAGTGARIVVTGAGNLPIQTLNAIAANGKGAVSFED